jgi:hypothetical protein
MLKPVDVVLDFPAWGSEISDGVVLYLVDEAVDCCAGSMLVSYVKA